MKRILLLFAFFLMVGFVYADADTNVTVAYHLDETGGTSITDSSDNNFHAQNQGAEVNKVAKSGAFGTSYFFKKSELDFLNKSHENELDFGVDDFGFCYFINTNSTPDIGTSNQYHLSYWLTDSEQRGWYVVADGANTITFNTLQQDINSSVLTHTSSSNLLSRWVQVCGARYANQTICLWTDNQAEETCGTRVVRNVTNDDEILYIGKRIDGRSFDGRMDEVVIWDKVIGSTEISTHFVSQIEGVASGPANVTRGNFTTTHSFDNTTVLEERNAWINITINTTNDGLVNATLYYNNSIWNDTTILHNGTSWLFSNNITVPFLNANTNIPFYWDYLVSKNYYFYTTLESIDSYWQMNYDGVHSDNLSVSDIEGDNSGTLNGYKFNHGTLMNATVNNTFGKYGKGAWFDGDGDYINISLDGSISGYTVLFWGKSNVVIDDTWFFGHLESGGNRIYFRKIGDDIQYTVGGGQQTTFADVVTAKTWNFYGITYDGSSCTAYFNTMTSTFACADLENLSNAFIGAKYDATNTLNGSIDSFVIYNRSLTNNSVLSIYNNQTKYTPIGEGLIAQYAFENSNTTHTFDENNLVVGKWEEANYFDGVDDYISIPSKTYDLDRGTTFSFWLNRKENDNHLVLANSTGYSFRRIIFLSSPAGRLYIESNTDGDSCFGDAGSSSYDGTWHNYAISIKDYICNIYEDGVNITTDSSLSANITLNRIGGAGSYPFNGSIDDVMIFNKSLNQEEITRIYNHTFRANASENQFSNQFNLDRCGTFTDIALNFSIFDERNLNVLNASVEGTFLFHLENGNQIKNLTIDTGNLTNFSICITPNFANIITDAYFQYLSEGDLMERYYIVNASINSTTQNVDIFNFKDSTGTSELEATVVRLFSPVTNILMKMQRFYPNLNAWKTVQIDKSDDQGRGIFYVFQNDVDYRFIWQENSTILDLKVTGASTEPLKFICDTSTECTQTFPISSIDEASVFAGVGASMGYNNETGIITFSWTDSNNLISSIRLLVQKQLGSEALTLCDDTVSSSSGTIVCNISGQSGIITVRAFRAASPARAFFYELIEKALSPLYESITDDEGNFWGGALVVTAGTMGVANPFLGILAVILAVILTFMFKLSSLFTLSFTVMIASLGIIIGFMIKRR